MNAVQVVSAVFHARVNEYIAASDEVELEKAGCSESRIMCKR